MYVVSTLLGRRGFQAKFAINYLKLAADSIYSWQKTWSIFDLSFQV